MPTLPPRPPTDPAGTNVLESEIMSMLAAGKGWTPEERDAYLRDLSDSPYESPLFADDVSEMDPALVDALTAIRDGDDTPLESATEHKMRGNECFKRVGIWKLVGPIGEAYPI